MAIIGHVVGGDGLAVEGASGVSLASRRLTPAEILAQTQVVLVPSAPVGFVNALIFGAWSLIPGDAPYDPGGHIQIAYADGGNIVAFGALQETDPTFASSGALGLFGAGFSTTLTAAGSAIVAYAQDTNTAGDGQVLVVVAYIAVPVLVA